VSAERPAAAEGHDRHRAAHLTESEDYLLVFFGGKPKMRKNEKNRKIILRLLPPSCAGDRNMSAPPENPEGQGDEDEGIAKEGEGAPGDAGRYVTVLSLSESRAKELV
jgi:hypothetical protein